MKWNAIHAGINSNGVKDSSDYGLILYTATLVDGKYVCGYASTQEYISNIETFTFDLYTSTAYTKSSVSIIAIDDEENQIPLGVYKNTANTTVQNITVDCSLVKTGNYKIMFKFDTTSTAAGGEYVRIDNIKINAN
jgi:hypothetical protein